MSHISHRGVRWPVGVCFAVLLVFPTALLRADPQTSPTDQAQTRFYSEDLAGVNLEGLTEEQRQLALKVLNESACNCGCAMTVAQCRVEDQNCDTSPALARAIVDAVRRGEAEEGVLAAYRKAAGLDREPRRDLRPVQQEIELDGSPVRGDESAPITIVEFADFQCPFCLRAQPVLQQLLEIYPGKVKIVFKHLPLSIHPDARNAARLAAAAHAQGKFWEMHDVLFSRPANLGRPSLASHAAEAGLDVDRFKADLDSAEVEARIERDLALADRLGASNTPAFFVNGKRVRSYQLKSFRVAIDRALSELDTAAAR